MHHSLHYIGAITKRLDNYLSVLLHQKVNAFALGVLVIPISIPIIIDIRIIPKNTANPNIYNAKINLITSFIKFWFSIFLPPQ